MTIREYLFGRSDILEDLEEDAEKDIEILRDILFLHKQKMDAIRELFVIWQTGSKVDKIDDIGKWIRNYNLKLWKLTKGMLRISTRDHSIVKMLIARNEEIVGVLAVHDIEELLKRMEGQLRLLKTIIHELNFIISEQLKYSLEKRKGIVAILKEIKEHKPFYNLIQDEIELERKINNLVKMFEQEALILHKPKKRKLEGKLLIEEVYSPKSPDFELLYKTVYLEAFPDTGELLALEDFKEELEIRYRKLDKTHYHILILKVGTTPVGGIMFDLYLFQNFCVGMIYYYFIDKKMLEDIQDAKPAKILMNAAISMLNRDAKNAGYAQVSALVAEVDNPEKKTEYKLKTPLSKTKLKLEEAKSYRVEIERIVDLYKRNGYQRLDFTYIPSDL